MALEAEKSHHVVVALAGKHDLAREELEPRGLGTVTLAGSSI